MAATTQQTRYRLKGMDCGSCAAKIDTAVRRMPGVEDVSVSATAGTMTVSHNGASDLPTIEAKVRGLGFEVSPLPVKTPLPAPASDACGRGRDHDHGDSGNEHGDHGHEHAHDHDDHDHGHGQAAKKAATASLHSHDHGPGAGPWWNSAKGRLTLASGGALAVAYVIGLLIPTIGLHAFVAAMLVGLVPIARRAAMAALAGSPFSIEMLMTTAALGATFIGAGEEAATVVFLFLVGELLEGVAAGRARANIGSLSALVPKTALVERAGGVEEVPAESLAIGAIVLVRPGDRIPADGDIVAGDSAIDEAPVTGESAPKRKSVGDAVFAGTINADAVLRVRVTASAADNTIARVVKLVEEAQESKAPTERIIDRFARWYTPAVLVVGALVAIAPPLLAGASWREWIYKGLAILLIGCPCALVISTPAAIAAALSSGARRGLLMKGGAVLEGLGKITAAAFDKTGTLTQGRPEVTDVIGFGRSERDVLMLAAGLETGSSHPCALAILGRAKAEEITPPAVEGGAALGGKGVTGRIGGEDLFLGSVAAASERAPMTAAQLARADALHEEGKTVSVLIVGSKVAGLIAMRDEPRADAKAGIEALSALGVASLMLTGDNERTAAAIAHDLGIEPRAGLLPEDKQRIVRELQGNGSVVAKIGDGINDAPALAAANIGIAMVGGTDVALETADAAVLHGRVIDVARMVALSRRTMANIRQNMGIALGLKAVFLATTIAGITGLWPAILADTGATVLVTMNALRLLQAPR